MMEGILGEAADRSVAIAARRPRLSFVFAARTAGYSARLRRSAIVASSAAPTGSTSSLKS
jgi:hypothetical protein